MTYTKKQQTLNESLPQKEKKEDHEFIATISSVLSTLGIPLSLKGYCYLWKAVMFVIEEPELIHSLTTKLYPKIAEYYKTTNVERSIKYAIGVSFSNISPDVFDSYFGNIIDTDKKKITIGEFIATIYEQIMLQQKEEEKDVEFIQVSTKLRQLAIPPHLKGYTYLRQALLFVLQEPELIHSLTTKLYPKIAEHYKTTDSKVERVMKHAIQAGLSRVPTNILRSHFKYTMNSTSIGEFIATLYNEIMLQQKEGEENAKLVQISSELRKLGLPEHFIGYTYLQQALIFVIKEPSLLNSLTTKLYSKVAKHYKTTVVNVIRTINHAIEIAFLRSNLGINDSFKRKLSNGEVITIVYNRIEQS